METNDPSDHNKSLIEEPISSSKEPESLETTELDVVNMSQIVTFHPLLPNKHWNKNLAIKILSSCYKTSFLKFLLA